MNNDVSTTNENTIARWRMGRHWLESALPEWWESQLRNDSDKLLHVEFRGMLRERVCGEIHAELGRVTLKFDEMFVLRSAADALKSRALHVSGAPVVATRPPESFDKAWLYAPFAYANGMQFDAPVLLAANDDFFVTIQLLGPSAKSSPEWWEVNKATFALVRDSLRVGAAAESEPPSDAPAAQTSA